MTESIRLMTIVPTITISRDAESSDKSEGGRSVPCSEDFTFRLTIVLCAMNNLALQYVIG